MKGKLYLENFALSCSNKFVSPKICKCRVRNASKKGFYKHFLGSKGIKLSFDSTLLSRDCKIASFQVLRMELCKNNFEALEKQEKNLYAHAMAQKIVLRSTSDERLKDILPGACEKNMKTNRRI